MQGNYIVRYCISKNLEVDEIVASGPMTEDLAREKAEKFNRALKEGGIPGRFFAVFIG